MTAQIHSFERSLASGKLAQCFRIEPDHVQIQPLFTEKASSVEDSLARVLGEARLQTKLQTVLPADSCLEQPEPMTIPELDGLICLADRARSAIDSTQCASPLHLLRLASARLRPGELLINGGYFLFLPPDVAGLWNAYGDPIGLTATASRIETPPQLNRACLLVTHNGPAIRRLSFSDIKVQLPDGQMATTHPFGTPAKDGPFTAFALFHGSLSAATPHGGDAWDVAYVGTQPIAMKQGGKMPIPRAGCVVRLPGSICASDVGPVTYKLDEEIIEGVQAGPLIVENGTATEAARDVFAEELMHPHSTCPDNVPISPYRWAADWHQTRTARLAAGLSKRGRLFFCAVQGSSSFFRGDSEAEGATLHDLALLMVEEGAITAMNLDGGGSTQVFCEGGGALLAPRDVHHGRPNDSTQFDRPLPLALRLS